MIAALSLVLALAADPVTPSTEQVSVSAEQVSVSAEQVSVSAEKVSVSMEQVSASYVLKVANRTESLDAIVAMVKAEGGWFARLSNDDHVDLRVPVAKLEAVQAFIEEQGLVADRNLATVDSRREVAELEARLKSRRELVGQYFALMAESKLDGVFQLEAELALAISELERLEGRMRLLKDRAATASVTVSFQFRDRRRSAAAQASPFGWVNELDVRRALGDLQYARAHTDKRPSLPRMPVVGFASYRLKKEFRASSPNGVVVRTRAVKHKPKADLAFWAEAVQTHLVGQGYILQRDVPLDGARWLEWAVPSAVEELTYVTVLHPAGNKLNLVEVAGTAEGVEGHRDVVLAAVTTGLEATSAAP